MSDPIPFSVSLQFIILSIGLLATTLSGIIEMVKRSRLEDRVKELERLQAKKPREV